MRRLTSPKAVIGRKLQKLPTGLRRRVARFVEADASAWRQDACGAWMRRDQFGHEQSEFGWKVENVSKGGPDTLENLRPFHWRNSFDIGNNAAHCKVSAGRSGVMSGEYAGPPRNRGA